MSQKTVLIDGHNLLFRAHFALISRPLVNSKGVTTSGLFNIIRILRKLREDKEIIKAVFCLDSKVPGFRKKLYPGYKASRPKPADEILVQLSYLSKLLPALGFPIVEVTGYEADDLIAGLVRLERERGDEVVILSSDKDMGQLIKPGVTMRVFEKGVRQTKDLDSEGIKEKMGVPPESVIDFQGLAGDKIDDIPGVPGIGEKTALALLKDHAHLEDIYRDLEKIKPPRVKVLLTEYKDQAFLSRDLARLDETLPPDVTAMDLTLKPEDVNALADLFQELEFKLPLPGYHPPAVLSPPPQQQEPAEVTDLPLWGDSAQPESGKPAEKMWGITVVPGESIIASDGEKTQKFAITPGMTRLPAGFPAQWAVLSYKKWLESGLPAAPKPLLDIELCDYLLHPDLTPHTLATMLSRYFNLGSTVAEPESGLFPDTGQQADDQAKHVAMLALYFQQNLPTELRKVHNEIELPLIPILVEMEKTGIKLDATILEQISRTMAMKLADLEARIHAMAGHEFNIQSPQQLAHVLFAELNLPSDKSTKTGQSTDIEVLTKLAQMHDLPKLIIQYRTIAKLKNTYVDVLPTLLGKDGRLHTTFLQTVASTGRLSSMEPNLQNIPIRDQGSEVRKAFIAEPGWCLLSADYSQIELRILAHFSQDNGLIDAFEHDEDIHRHTASDLFGVDMDDVTNDMRSAAKAVNFGIAYGLSAFGLSKQIGIEPAVAKAHIDRYFSRYPGVKKFIETAIKSAEEKGYAETMLGRRLPLRDINSPNRVVKAAAERVAINMPIQGTAADMMKLAMIRVHKRLGRELAGKTRLVLTIHDELLLEVEEGSQDAAFTICREEMQSALELIVPVKVNISDGANWLEAH
jgi:DNA polymerase I